MTPTQVALLFIGHLFGDYVLQSDWMANMKTKANTPAFAHAFVYTLCYLPATIPYMSVGAGFASLFIIGSTHFVIDRWRLARYVCWAKNFLSPRESRTDEKGVAVTIHADKIALGSIQRLKRADGVVAKMVVTHIAGDTVTGNNIALWWHPWEECKGTGYHKERPPWMAVWLLIIADNALHLACNLTALVLV